MAKRGKVLEISSYPPPRAGWGVRVEFVKKQLEEDGHICEVLNIAPESRKIASDEYLTARNGLDYVWKIFTRVLRRYRVHMHTNGDSPKGFILTLLALSISALLFKRGILTFHAGPYQKYFPQERAPQLTLMYKLIFHLSKEVICNSEPVKEKIIGYGINPAKIHTIQAFSRQYLQHQDVAPAGRTGEFLKTGKPVISSYVFFRPEFFIDRMIDAIDRLRGDYPELRLIILGSADHSEEIQAQITRLGLDDFVHIAGDQDHDSFLSIIKKSAIFLRTPVKDGVASSVLESLSLGTVVVASENNTRPESSVTYDNENLDDMVAKLKDVIDHPEKYNEALIKPVIRDTVADEIAILLK